MKRRIMFAIVGVAAAAVIALAIPLAIGAGRLYQEDEVLSLERDATAAARGFDASAQAGDPVEFASSPDGLAAYDHAGRLLSGSGPAQADALVRESLATGRVMDKSTDDELVVTVPILANERVAGAIRASRSTAELSERTMRMRLTIAAAAAVIIALAAAAALAVSRRLTRPVFELAEAAAAIEDGREGVHSPRSGISELDTVAEALDETAARLGAVVARERSFSADASHQLRTPLAALRLGLETAQLNGREVSEELGQVDRLENTIDALLAAARDARSQSKPFDLGAVIEEARRAWTGLLAEQGRPLEIAAPRDLPKAKATIGAVREIIDVLITNAVQHGDGAIRLTARPLEHSIAVDVSDQGPGVADPSTAFDRRTGPGHGIGLALARSLAEADGGRLDLIDHRPGNTKFTLLLPAEA
jgi:signal transduction histidine kinase